MTRPLITRFAQRLKRIGVDVELVANYPWVYMTHVNGVPVTEKFMANHGFTAFFVHRDERWSDRRRVFAKIRELLSGNANALLDIEPTAELFDAMRETLDKKRSEELGRCPHTIDIEVFISDSDKAEGDA